MILEPKEGFCFFKQSHTCRGVACCSCVFAWRLSKNVNLQLWLIYCCLPEMLFILSLWFPRPRKNPAEESGRDLVCPVILKQSEPVLEQEEEDMDDEADKCSRDIIRIGKNVVFLSFYRLGYHECHATVKLFDSDSDTFFNTYTCNPSVYTLPHIYHVYSI